ncbi:MAG: Lrp/AsnC family transcriptional regulator [Gemmatimonadota bacterium]
MRDSRLDEIDVKILNLLQEDARMSQQDLADAVGLSSPATGERVRKLVDRGVIRGFTAVLDPKKVGRDVTAFVSVGIDGSEYFSEFVEKATDAPEVLECHAITGSGSHILKTRTTNTSTLEELLARIQSWPGVSWTTTNVVLSVAKETSRIVMEPPKPEKDEE